MESSSPRAVALPEDYLGCNFTWFIASLGYYDTSNRQGMFQMLIYMMLLRIKYHFPA
ncbi:hypothetical protein BHM03_00024692 [Ensete ventricosum]|nr:hypothetical protein BHM03_00024692 [Ensete ventricosum]